MGARTNDGMEASPRRTLRGRSGLRDLKHYDDERLEAAIQQFIVEKDSRVSADADAGACAGWAETADAHLENAKGCRREGRVEAAWTSLKAAQRELVCAFDETELLVEANRLRKEASAKLTGWRARAVKDALLGVCEGPREASRLRDRVIAALDGTSEGAANKTTEPAAETADSLETRIRAALAHTPRRDKSEEIEDLRIRVKTARFILDEHTDNVYRRLYLLRGHLRWGAVVLATVVVLALGTVAGALATGWEPADGAPLLSDVRSFLVLMVLGALGAALSGVVTLLARDPEQRIPDVRAQRLLVWLRPPVGAAAAVVAVALFESGLAGVSVDPEATFAVALVAGFSERFVGRAVAAASATLER